MDSVSAAIRGFRGRVIAHSSAVRGVAICMAAAVFVPLLAVPAQATFPGLNGKIVFTANLDIYVMNADGSGQTNLTNSPAKDTSPHWSPDGTKIAFYSTQGGGSGDVWVMNADGSAKTNLTNTFAGEGPSGWSPDGARILFSSTRDGNAEIYVMNANGSGQTRLTNDPATDGAAVFSPDGTQIAFDSSRAGNRDIWLMNADGSGPTNLTSDPADDVSADWSPDGTKIAFDSTRADPSLPYRDIWMMNADGSGSLNFSSELSAFNMWPAFSPDGTQIAFVRGGSEPAVHKMNVDGSGRTNLTFPPLNADVQVPDWQPVFYVFTGFFQPVDNLPTMNAAKAGSAIPIEFGLNGNQGLAIFAANYPKSQQIACDPTATVDGIESTVTAGSSSLSYDAVADNYTYVWKTEKGWAGTCRQLVVKLNDGTSHRANFKFK